MLLCYTSLLTKKYIFFRAKKQHEDEVFNLQQQVNQLSSQNKRLEKEVETLRSYSDETFLRKRKPLKLIMEDLV
jgi:cell division protein FtsB